MKKLGIVSIFLIICIIVFVTVTYADKNNTWDVFKPNYKVTINGVPAEEVTNHQILECEGVTYLALKDWAPILDARFDDINKDDQRFATNIWLRSGYGKEILFDDMESIKEIGELLAKDRYGNKITNETLIYPIGSSTINGAFDFYEIYIFFDGGNVEEEKFSDGYAYADSHADKRIRYYIKSGEIKFFENNGNGRMTLESEEEWGE